MNVYDQFAAVYDVCMSEVPYDKWVARIISLWKKYGRDPKLILELGCGTGNMAFRFAARGYETIAADISPAMLSFAEEKNGVSENKVLFINQDIRKLDLYGTVDSVYSVFDTINYILSVNELFKVFSGVEKFLNPGGLFIFDINTDRKYRLLTENGASSKVTEKFSYIWENTYDQKKRVNECAAHFFILDESRGTYEKFTEYHYQRSYDYQEIIKTAEDAGLKCIGVIDAVSLKKISGESLRVYYILEKERNL